MFRVMAVFIQWPILTAIPCVVFLVLFALSRKALVLVAAVAWLAYLPYEYAMKLRILCTGECNIRVDLLLLYPALAALSGAALVVFGRWAAKRSG
jgi:hypothetical protein